MAISSTPRHFEATKLTDTVDTSMLIDGQGVRRWIKLRYFDHYPVLFFAIRLFLNNFIIFTLQLRIESKELSFNSSH